MDGFWAIDGVETRPLEVSTRWLGAFFDGGGDGRDGGGEKPR